MKLRREHKERDPSDVRNVVVVHCQLPAVVHRVSLDRDWDDLVALRLGAERRIREKGSSQWSDTARGLEQMMHWVNRDEMMIIRRGPRAVGCFALTNDGEPEFWGSDPDRDQSVYLHKAITSPHAAHTGIGELIVSHSIGEARARRAVAVRIEVWKGPNGAGAVRRWEELGFRHVRELDLPGRDVGVLMEIRVLRAEPGTSSPGEANAA